MPNPITAPAFLARQRGFTRDLVCAAAGVPPGRAARWIDSGIFHLVSGTPQTGRGTPRSFHLLDAYALGFFHELTDPAGLGLPLKAAEAILRSAFGALTATAGVTSEDAAWLSVVERTRLEAGRFRQPETVRDPATPRWLVCALVRIPEKPEMEWRARWQDPGFELHVDGFPQPIERPRILALDTMPILLRVDRALLAHLNAAALFPGFGSGA